jgi:hypothetical protein
MPSRGRTCATCAKTFERKTNPQIFKCIKVPVWQRKERRETCTTTARQIHPNKVGPIRAVSAPRRARPPQLPSLLPWPLSLLNEFIAKIPDPKNPQNFIL